MYVQFKNTRQAVAVVQLWARSGQSNHTGCCFCRVVWDRKAAGKDNGYRVVWGCFCLHVCTTPTSSPPHQRNNAEWRSAWCHVIWEQLWILSLSSCGNLCRSSITATGVEAHKQIRLEKISLLIWDKGHLKSSSCAREKLLSPPAEPAPTKQIIKSSVSDFLVGRRTKEASWVERNHILLLCGLAANKSCFSAEQDPC